MSLANSAPKGSPRGPSIKISSGRRMDATASHSVADGASPSRPTEEHGGTHEQPSKTPIRFKVSAKTPTLPTRPSSGPYDMHTMVETSLALEKALHPDAPTDLLSPEEMLKRAAVKENLESLTALDLALSTEVYGYRASHEGYLTYMTMSLLEETHEDSKGHFFAKNLSEHEIHSRYVQPQSMDSTLAYVAQHTPGDDYLLEQLALKGVPSAVDAMEIDHFSIEPSQSPTRRLDEIYNMFHPKLDNSDLREMIRSNRMEDKVKAIKKRQRPATLTTPHYVNQQPPASTKHPKVPSSTRFEKPDMPSILRMPANKKRRLYIEGCVPAVEYRFVDMEFHEEETDLRTLRADNGRLNWTLIVKREIPRVAPIHSNNHSVKLENAAVLARAARDAVLARVMQVKTKSQQTQLKAQNLARSIYSFVRRNEKEWKLQAEREAAAMRKEEQDMQDKERATKKLNFLITQTELYSHFMAKKLGIQAAEDEMEKIKSGTSDVKLSADNSGTLPLTGDVSMASMNPEDEEQMNRAKQEALVAYKQQRARIDTFDQQSAKLRGEAPPSKDKTSNRMDIVENAPGQHSATGTGPTPSGHRRTGGIVTQNTPILSSANAEGQSSLIGQPRDLLCTLKPYQVKGLNWLNNLYEQGINGILADEMGLGKTVQTISMLAHLAETRGIWGPFIVIAPTSTLPNWVNEFAKFYPTFKVLPYYGTAKQRASLRKLLNPSYLHRPDSVVHVVVTSYNLVVTDEKHISRIYWEYMVLDEAHAIKSSRSIRWQTLLGFSNTRNRLLLTGTPIQNNMAELWALLHFIMPTLFDSHNEFAEWFSKDIEDHAAGGTGLNETQLTRLHMILKPFMLRRVKVDVQNELPSKTEIEIRCDMTARQRALYSGIRNHLSIHDLFDRINVPTGKAAMERQAKTLMNIVMQFRNVCNHPEILERSETESPLQFSLPTPPVVSYGTIIASANRNWIEYHLPRLIYQETFLNLDPRRAGTEAEQTTRYKWLQHRFNIFSQLHIHSSIFGGRFSPGEISRPSVPSPSSSPELAHPATTTLHATGSNPMIQMLSQGAGTPSNAMAIDSPPLPPLAIHSPPTKRSFKEILSSKRGGANTTSPNKDTEQQPPQIATPPPAPSKPAIAISAQQIEPALGVPNVFYRDDDSKSYADLHCWDFVRLMDSCPSEVEWMAQASILHMWMATLASRERDTQISDCDEYGASEKYAKRATTRSLRIVPVSSPLALWKLKSFKALSELVYEDAMERVEENMEMIQVVRGAYHPTVWSAPQGLYCADRRFMFYQDQLESDCFVTRMLLGEARQQSGPEHLFREVSSVRLVRPSVPMARPWLNVFGLSRIRVPQYSELVRDSGKLKKLDHLLRDLKKGGHRVLVYSQFTEVLDLLEDFMFVRGYKFVRLDGSSKLDDRRDMVDAFQTNPSLFIFLLSTRAGGLGINLTAADTVIFYDSDWNPTMDSQAMDRAHRLGQTRPVTVYRLITRNSIEERILQRAKQKGTIQNLVIQGGRFNLGSDELDSDLFKPAEMMDLLLDDDQLSELNKTEAAKKKKTIINPIKLGMKRSAKPTPAKPQEPRPASRATMFDESVSSDPVPPQTAPETNTTSSATSTSANTEQKAEKTENAMNVD